MACGHVEKDVMKAVSAANLVNYTGCGDLAGNVKKTYGVERSSSGVLASGTLSTCASKLRLLAGGV